MGCSGSKEGTVGQYTRRNGSAFLASPARDAPDGATAKVQPAGPIDELTIELPTPSRPNTSTSTRIMPSADGCGTIPDSPPESPPTPFNRRLSAQSLAVEDLTRSSELLDLLPQPLIARRTEQQQHDAADECGRHNQNQGGEKDQDNPKDNEVENEDEDEDHHHQQQQQRQTSQRHTEELLRQRHLFEQRAASLEMRLREADSAANQLREQQRRDLAALSQAVERGGAAEREAEALRRQLDEQAKWRERQQSAQREIVLERKQRQDVADAAVQGERVAAREAEEKLQAALAVSCADAEEHKSELERVRKQLSLQEQRGAERDEELAHAVLAQLDAEKELEEAQRTLSERADALVQARQAHATEVSALAAAVQHEQELRQDMGAEAEALMAELEAVHTERADERQRAAADFVGHDVVLRASTALGALAWAACDEVALAEEHERMAAQMEAENAKVATQAAIHELSTASDVGLQREVAVQTEPVAEPELEPLDANVLEREFEAGLLEHADLEAERLPAPLPEPAPLWPLELEGQGVDEGCAKPEVAPSDPLARATTLLHVAAADLAEQRTCEACAQVGAASALLGELVGDREKGEGESGALKWLGRAVEAAATAVRAAQDSALPSQELEVECAQAVLPPLAQLLVRASAAPATMGAAELCTATQHWLAAALPACKSPPLCGSCGARVSELVVTLVGESAVVATEVVALLLQFFSVYYTRDCKPPLDDDGQLAAALLGAVHRHGRVRVSQLLGATVGDTTRDAVWQALAQALRTLGGSGSVDSAGDTAAALIELSTDAAAMATLPRTGNVAAAFWAGWAVGAAQARSLFVARPREVVVLVTLAAGVLGEGRRRAGQLKTSARWLGSAAVLQTLSCWLDAQAGATTGGLPLAQQLCVLAAVAAAAVGARQAAQLPPALPRQAVAALCALVVNLSVGCQDEGSPLLHVVARDAAWLHDAAVEAQGALLRQACTALQAWLGLLSGDEALAVRCALHGRGVAQLFAAVLEGSDSAPAVVALDVAARRRAYVPLLEWALDGFGAAVPLPREGVDRALYARLMAAAPLAKLPPLARACWLAEAFRRNTLPSSREEDLLPVTGGSTPLVPDEPKLVEALGLAIVALAAPASGTAGAQQSDDCLKIAVPEAEGGAGTAAAATALGERPGRLVSAALWSALRPFFRHVTALVRGAAAGGAAAPEWRRLGLRSPKSAQLCRLTLLLTLLRRLPDTLLKPQDGPRPHAEQPLAAAELERDLTAVGRLCVRVIETLVLGSAQGADALRGDPRVSAAIAGLATLAARAEDVGSVGYGLGGLESEQLAQFFGASGSEGAQNLGYLLSPAQAAVGLDGGGVLHTAALPALLTRCPTLFGIRVKLALLRAKLTPLQPKLTLTFDRKRLLENARAHFALPTVKHAWRVAFMGEEALDRGGVRKELFTLLGRELVRSCHGLFRECVGSERGCYYLDSRPRADRREETAARGLLRLAGRFMGKVLLEGEVASLQLAPYVYKRILSRPVCYTDVRYTDPDFYANQVVWIRDHDISGVLFEHFVDGEGMPLCSGGADRPVTEANKFEYLDLLVEARLGGGADDGRWGALLAGLTEVVPRATLHCFCAAELSRVLGGEARVDMAQLRKHTRLTGGYGTDDATVGAFWKAVEEMAQPQRARLLQFVTGSSRLPAGGAGALEPPLTIQRVESSTRLPSASTCFNLLKLPDFCNPEGEVGSASVLRAKLDLALTDGAEGFAFS
eukprot:SAG11_NODE_37_length_21777_cov_4.523711_12_plen_1735_part_00